MLKNIYRSIDWTAFYRSAPEFTREEVDLFFHEIKESLKEGSSCAESSAPEPAAPPPDGKAVLYCDGASSGNPGPAGIGVLMETPDGVELAAWGRAIGETTNNVAEYTALLEGLGRAVELGVSDIEIRTDSQLMERQLKGMYRVRNDGLKPLFRQVSALLDSFESWTVKHIDRQYNKKADALAGRHAAKKKKGQSKK